MMLQSIRMHAVLFCCSLVFCLTHVSSVTVTTPAIQRKIVGESCRFRWSITGSVTTYSIKLLSTGSSLGPNANQTLDSVKGLITLFIWNIQLSDAGYYSLTINAESSSSIAVLFVYGYPSSSIILAAGRNPGFQGDKVELNCSGTSYSSPVSDRPKMYYFWYSGNYGFLRNISSGPAMLQNGDDVPRYSIKNDGSTLVIASALPTDTSFSCSVQEEGSPYKSYTYTSLGLTIYGKPYPTYFYPASRKLNQAISSNAYLYFNFQRNPPLISCTNWSFVDASGTAVDYSAGSSLLTNSYAPLSFNPNSYGNVSITLTNSNGSTTVTFQILPPGPPDTPSNFSVLYLSSSRVSLQWRCMWYNGVQQTVSVRLTDVASNTEVETRNTFPDIYCYGSRYSTLFQGNIQPERNYSASIWSTNSLGSSDVVNLAIKTPKRVIFSVSPANILIVETVATINFRILDSIIPVIRLNVTCCVEITAECNNKSYILASTDNQIVYDNLPYGTDYAFDFKVFDTDGYTYDYNLALVKGVRVSTGPTTEFTTPTAYIPNGFTTPPYVNNDTEIASYDKGNPLLIPVIVLAVLLGVAVLVLLGCCIGLLVFKCRRNNSQQVSTAARTTVPKRNNVAVRESTDSFEEDNYEPVVDMDRSKNNVYYKTLEGAQNNDMQSSGAWHTGRSFESGKDDINGQNPYMNPDELYYKKANETLDRPKKSRYN